MSSPHNRRPSKQPRVALVAAAVVLAAGLCLPAPAVAQNQQLNPVYVDDSPVAAETMSRVRDHVGAGNIDEAVRVLQALLDEQGDRVLGVAGEPDVFISVRESVHRLVFGDARLLDRYRQNIGPRAAAMLERGETAAVERQCLMTAPGFEAALRVAQTQLEAAQFEAALRTLAQLEDHPDRRAEPGRAAAELVAAIAEYLPRAEIVALADRWARQVGASSPDAEAVPWPAAAIARSQSPIDRAAPLRTEGLVSKPLWSEEYAPPPPLDDSFIKDLPDAGLPRSARDLTVMPAVSGELVFVNDGTTISAWDQYTLAERWRVNPGAIDPPNVPGGRRPGTLLQPNFRAWTLTPPDIASARRFERDSPRPVPSVPVCSAPRRANGVKS